MVYIGSSAEGYVKETPTGGSLLPVGVMLTGIITRTQMKGNSAEAKDPQGQKLEVEFDISNPPELSNRKFWDNFNIVNSNKDTKRIAEDQLKNLHLSCGLVTLGEEEELHGKEVCFVLKIKPAEGKWSAKNECVRYWPVGSTIEQHIEWQGNKRGAAPASAPIKQAWGAKPTTAEASTAPAEKKVAPWASKKST